MKGIRLRKELKGSEDKEKVMKLCESLGDFYHEIERPDIALEYYLQQVSVFYLMSHV